MNGFVEIEKGNRFVDNGESESVVQRHKDFHDQISYDSTISYYSWAREKANHARFASARDYMIWERHAEGISQRKIATSLGYKNNQSVINKRLKAIKEYLTQDSASFTVEQIMMQMA